MLRAMADPTFIITPSGDDYSMVSDDFFDSLQTKKYSQSVLRENALDWMLNVKKFCVVEKSSGGCMRGVYEATYGIDDYSNYASPVTNLSSSYKEPQIGGSDSDVLTGTAGEVMQTSPRNPHHYTLQSDTDNVGDTPPSLTGEYLGAFFHHKGYWYASHDDMANISGDDVSIKSISGNKKRSKAGPAEKEIFVLNKFYPNGYPADIEQCACVCEFIEGVSGGNDPYSGTFQINQKNVPTTLEITFEAYGLKDAITVTADSGETWSSGCVANLVTTTLFLPNGAQSISVEVEPRCDPSQPQSSTEWYFTIQCINNEPP